MSHLTETEQILLAGTVVGPKREGPRRNGGRSLGGFLGEESHSGRLEVTPGECLRWSPGGLSEATARLTHQLPRLAQSLCQPDLLLTAVHISKHQPAGT